MYIAALVLGWAISRFLIGGVIGEVIAIVLLFTAIMVVVTLLGDRRKRRK